nr:Chain C, Sendai virus nucleoprotein [Respirovirus muris]
FAPGNYPAW